MKKPIPTVPRAALSPREFAEKYGFSHAFVYELAKRGGLRIRKAGGRSIITTDDERAWLDSLPALNEATA